MLVTPFFFTNYDVFSKQRGKVEREIVRLKSIEGHLERYKLFKHGYYRFKTYCDILFYFRPPSIFFYNDKSFTGLFVLRFSRGRFLNSFGSPAFQFTFDNLLGHILLGCFVSSGRFFSKSLFNYIHLMRAI